MRFRLILTFFTFILSLLLSSFALNFQNTTKAENLFFSNLKHLSPEMQKNLTFYYNCALKNCKTDLSYKILLNNPNNFSRFKTGRKNRDIEILNYNNITSFNQFQNLNNNFTTNTSKIDPRFNFDQMLLNAQRLNDKKKEKTYTIIHNENLSNINETFLNDIVIYNDVEFNKACNYSQNENFHKNSAILKYNNITGDLILCLFNINDTFDMKKNSSFNETNENFFNLKNDTFNTEKKFLLMKQTKTFLILKMIHLI